MRRVESAFADYLESEGSVDLLWSDKVGYVFLTINEKTHESESCDDLHTATQLCHRLLDDMAITVLMQTKRNHNFSTMDKDEAAQVRAAWKPVIEKLPDYAYLCDEILREAMFYDGVSVEIRSAADDNRKQAEDVHYFIDKGVDLLIISANEAAPMTPIVEEAYQKGIPVILVDRKILSDKYTAYIGADNYEIGRAVGNYIASSLKGKGNVVELTGLGGSTPAMERHQGFMAAISNYPDIKLIDKADAAWEREPAEVEMDSMLHRHPKIDAVYAHNDRIAPGAYQAAKKAGREKEMILLALMPCPAKETDLNWCLTMCSMQLLFIRLMGTK